MELYTLDPNGESLKSVKNIKISVSQYRTISHGAIIFTKSSTKLTESLGSLSACLGLKPECNRILFRLITIHISSKTDPGVCCSSVVLFPSQGHSFARKLKSRGERRDWPSAKRGAKWKTRDVVPF